MQEHRVLLQYHCRLGYGPDRIHVRTVRNHCGKANHMSRRMIQVKILFFNGFEQSHRVPFCKNQLLSMDVFSTTPLLSNKITK